MVRPMNALLAAAAAGVFLRWLAAIVIVSVFAIVTACMALPVEPPTAPVPADTDADWAAWEREFTAESDR